MITISQAGVLIFFFLSDLFRSYPFSLRHSHSTKFLMCLLQCVFQNERILPKQVCSGCCRASCIMAVRNNVLLISGGLVIDSRSRIDLQRISSLGKGFRQVPIGFLLVRFSFCLQYGHSCLFELSPTGEFPYSHVRTHHINTNLNCFKEQLG
jgi:hypothetical protein